MEIQEKPPESRGFSVLVRPDDAIGITLRLAGHWRIALLNDALLKRLSRPVPGA
jgi:hypothetical protein